MAHLLEEETPVADDPPSPAAFSGFLSAFEGHGFDLGYQRGVADTLASMLFLIEPFLRERQVDDPRKLLYAFQLYVEQHPHPKARSGYVSDGLGI
jgi:hypothetical protein